MNELECIIPEAHPLWVHAKQKKGSVQPYVGVQVVMRTGVSNLEVYDHLGGRISIDQSDVLSDETVNGLLPDGNYSMDAPVGARIIPKGIA